MLFWLGWILALLAAVAVGWALPLLAVALLLPLLQMLVVLNHWLAAVIMLALGILLVWYCLHHGLHWQAITWGVLLGLGVLTAITGVFHWYALILESVLVVLLLIPGIVAPGWLQLVRWFVTGELALTILFIWGQGVGLPGTVLVMALLLIGLATLLGLGAYRPFEARRMRRRLAGLATAAAVLLVLWQPVILPAVNWAGQAAGQMGQAVATSPLARWYRTVALRAERTELGEASKTEALRQLQGPLTRAHRQRWEKAIQKIPGLPLASGEWKDLGIPLQADP